MSTQWMKQTLIASVLTVLMTLPALAQQRRLSGPARPAAGTPEKLEVPTKLQPLVQRAISATLQLQKARLEVLQVVKQLERLAGNADKSSGVSLPTAPTADKSSGVSLPTAPTANKSSMVGKSFRVTGGDVTFTAADGKAPHISQTTDRIKAGVLQAVAIPAFLRFVRKSRTSEAGVNIVNKKRLEDDLSSVGDDAQLEQLIRGLQKAIQDPMLRMEGNKLNFSISQPIY